MPRVKRIPQGFDLAEALRGLSIERDAPIARQIYEGLRKRIVDARLPAGAPLHENDMASALLVSRTPIRAALQQLVVEGLVETRPQVGSIVADRDRGRFLEALFVRSAIEGQIARRLAAEGVDASPLDTILARQKAAAAADDYAAFFDADEEFHELLATLASVPGAWQLVQTVKAHVDRERYLLMSSVRGRAARAYRDHLEILAAIRAGDAASAAAAMVRHIESVLNAPGFCHSAIVIEAAD